MHWVERMLFSAQAFDELGLIDLAVDLIRKLLCIEWSIDFYLNYLFFTLIALQLLWLLFITA